MPSVLIADDEVPPIQEQPREAEKPEIVEEVQPRISPANIYEKVNFYADKHGVDRWLLHHIVDAESDYNPNAWGDAHMPGGSTGLVQINHYWNPDVSPEEAKNPDFALDWAATRLAQGKCYLWSTCPLS